MSLPKNRPLPNSRRSSHYFDPSPAVQSRPRTVFLHLGELALELTRANAAATKTANVTASLPDDVPAELRFAAIYSNPPVRVGKGPLHELLLRWLPRLEAGASAYLVVQRNLGSDSLAAWLSTQGYEVRRLKSKKGYRILEVRGSEPSVAPAS